MSAAGPWTARHFSGGTGYRAGFYVERTNAGRTEWVKGRSGRAKRFETFDEALAIAAEMNGPPPLKEALDALRLYVKAGFGNSTDFALQAEAHRAAVKAIARIEAAA